MSLLIQQPSPLEVKAKLLEQNKKAAQNLLLRIRSQLAGEVQSVKVHSNGTTKN